MEWVLAVYQAPDKRCILSSSTCNSYHNLTVTRLLAWFETRGVEPLIVGVGFSLLYLALFSSV